jgi:hypothetical protein
LKLKLDKKLIDKLSERFDVIEEERLETSREEPDNKKEIKFAKMREARAKKTNAYGEKTYEDVWDNITQEELDFTINEKN